jgi:hypothetical protein
MSRTDETPVSELALEAQREQFHRELMRKSMRIAELELELKQVRSEYESSLSWRLTKPLRIRRYIRQRRAGHGPG